MKPAQRNLIEFTSEVLFLTGLSKCLTEKEIKNLLGPSCVDVDYSKRHQFGRVWARFTTVTEANIVKHQLHQSVHDDISVSCRFELGVDDKGKRIVPSGAHNTVIRNVGLRRGLKRQRISLGSSSKSSKSSTTSTSSTSTPSSSSSSSASSASSASASAAAAASYSYKSLTVGNVEYPFPSGLYLSRIIQLIQRWPREDPLVRMLTNVQSFGGKYSKEISEVMAMIDAVERGVKMTCGGGRPCCSLEGT